jgi:hypothetical protein
MPSSLSLLSHSYGAIGLLMRLLALPTKIKDKVVILTHEHQYYANGRNP